MHNKHIHFKSRQKYYAIYTLYYIYTILYIHYMIYTIIRNSLMCLIYWISVGYRQPYEYCYCY